jgi:hypothetical protein
LIWRDAFCVCVRRITRCSERLLPAHMIQPGFTFIEEEFRKSAKDASV